MSCPPDAFYLYDLPTSLQQGDIAVNVPLLMLPPADSLILVRPSRRFEVLQPGEATLVDERAVNDAFEKGSEYTIVSVQRAYSMLVTPTCDLQDEGGMWMVWPLVPVEGSRIDTNLLNAGRYANLYRLPNHHYFDPAFIDVTDVRPVRPEQFLKKNRIASTTREGQDELLQKFHRAMGRTWGYAEDEIIEPLGKYETGKFRCAQCNLYDVKVPEEPLEPGSHAPRCDNCKKIGKAAQWYPLTKHKK